MPDARFEIEHALSAKNAPWWGKRRADRHDHLGARAALRL